MAEATAIPVRVSSTVLASNGAKSKTMTIVVQIVSAMYAVAFLQVLYMACKAAYEIRMYAINEYGRVIHEFDPYFNYRAAEYLWQHGTSKFFRWFDYQSWYPLGRPVGTTIYPGMQFTSVWIKQFMLPAWSINDICCLLPAWFGVLATLCTAAFCFVAVQSTKGESKTSLFQDIPIVAQIYRAVVLPVVGAFASLLKKTTGSNWGIPFGTKRNPPALESAVFTACLMSIVPAHLMRSVAGGYDNESVATTAMQLTFCMWSLTLWAPEAYSLVLGALTGVAYFYMVTCWGGYIFVINLIGVHALCLLVLRKFSTWTHLYKSYTSFYIVGTCLAMRLPVVGWAPLKSLEQLGPFGVWFGMQVLHLMYVLERKYVNVNRWKIRSYVVVGCLMAAFPVAYYLWTSGYVGPLSSRVRGLFVKHTKTGNPLVDSVAEHQAASPQAYREYLNVASMLAPYGYGIVALFACTPSSSFLLLYGVAAYFFSHKMVRLILLTAPIASICGGIALGYTWAWMAGLLFGDERPSLGQLFDDVQGKANLTVDAVEATETEALNGASDQARAKNKAKGKKKNDNTGKTSKEGDSSDDNPVQDKAFSRGDPILIRAVRLIVSVLIIKEMIPRAKEFHATAHRMAKGMSHPTIIAKGRNERTGEDVLMDDYREAYWWLRDNTPEDSRIMAWWDYGYQITGISNRTTIADGNTWNHEHIALLGRILTSPEKEGHRIARHLADYVLIWAGGGGDDLAKSPHLVRIANSVYRFMCTEPTCRSFGMMSNGRPTPQLEASLLYRLHSHRLVEGVEADRNRFKEVFMSKYGKVRIFKVLKIAEESKEWVENNRLCDAPGSWFCKGQYPPALQKILKQKKDFKQLEDFNVKGEDDSEYQKAYFENLNGGNAVKRGSAGKEAPGPPKLKQLSKEEIDVINEDWEDNQLTTMMWETISKNDIRELRAALKEGPELAHIRSEDGRGPMWWAHENGRTEIIEILKKLGVSEERTDEKGLRPLDISKR